MAVPVSTIAMSISSIAMSISSVAVSAISSVTSIPVAPIASVTLIFVASVTATAVSKATTGEELRSCHRYHEEGRQDGQELRREQCHVGHSLARDNTSNLLFMLLFLPHRSWTF